MRIPGLWTNHDFTVLWSGRAVSELGSAVSFVALPLLTLTVGSASDAGGVLATTTVAGTAFALYAGAITDRVGRRAAMVVSALVRAAAYGWLSVVTTMGVLTLGQLYIVAAVTGVAGPFFTTAEIAAIRTVVPLVDLPTAYSQNQVRSMVADLCGSPLGGLLYGLGRALPFGVDAVSFCLEALVIRSIRSPLPAPLRREPRSVWRDIGSGLAFIWKHQFLRTTLLAGAIINFAALWPVLLLTLHDQGVPPSLIGATLAGLTASSLAGAFAAPALTRHAAPGVIIVLTSWVMVATLTAMTVASSALVIVIALLVGGTAIPAIVILLSSYEASVTPDNMIGRVSAAGSFIASATAPAGQVTGAALYGVAGSHVAFGMCTMAVLAGALLLTASPAVRHLQPTRPVPASPTGVGQSQQ